MDPTVLRPALKFTETKLPGVLLIEPPVYADDRGFFLETYHVEKFADAGISLPFVQDNHSKSSLGTLRGLHSQWRKPQGKLVRCVAGEIWDVAVDCRKGSPTFGEWVGATLSAENFHQLWVPPGLLHAFIVTSETAEVQYKCTDVYDPGYELGVVWNDPDIGIEWPLEAPTLSAKDAEAPRLSEVMEQLPEWDG